MKKHKHGYILIEVLTALSVMAIGLLAVTRSFAVSIKANDYGKDYIIAMLLARGRMTETINKAQSSLGSGTGTFAPLYPSYLWRTETGLVNNNTARVAVTVSWDKRGKESSFTLKTMVPLSKEGF